MFYEGRSVLIRGVECVLSCDKIDFYYEEKCMVGVTVEGGRSYSSNACIVFNIYNSINNLDIKTIDYVATFSLNGSYYLALITEDKARELVEEIRDIDSELVEKLKLPHETMLLKPEDECGMSEVVKHRCTCFDRGFVKTVCVDKFKEIEYRGVKYALARSGDILGFTLP